MSTENKIRVSACPGSDSFLGLMTPVVNMRVMFHGQEMYITSLDTGNYTVNLSFTQGGTEVAKAYPHQITISETYASSPYFSWPSGDGSVKSGHVTDIPASFYQAIGSGMTALSGDGTLIRFSRP